MRDKERKGLSGPMWEATCSALSLLHSVFPAICVLMAFSAVIRHRARCWGYSHHRVQGSHLMFHLMPTHEPPALGFTSPVGSDRKTCLKLCLASVFSPVK